MVVFILRRIFQYYLSLYHFKPCFARVTSSDAVLMIKILL